MYISPAIFTFSATPRWKCKIPVYYKDGSLGLDFIVKFPARNLELN